MENAIDCVNGETNYEFIAVSLELICASKTNNLWECANILLSTVTNIGESNWSKDYVQFTNGKNHFCGIDNEQSLWCWGYIEGNYYNTPIKNTGLWKKLWAGEDRLCAISNNDNLYCWQGSMLSEGTKVNDDTDWSTMSLGNDKFYAIKTDGTLWNWSFNETPSQIGENLWKYISNTSLYAIKADGTLHYVSDFSIEPIPVGTGTDWEAVYGTCAIKTDNSLWCWNDSEKTPYTRNTDFGWSCGEWAYISHYKEQFENYCGVKTDGSLWCWKDNIMTHITKLPIK